MTTFNFPQVWKNSMADNVDESKTRIQIPTWAIGIMICVVSWGSGALMNTGAKTSQLDSVISQEAAVQASLVTISDKLSKIEAHEVMGDTKFEDLGRRVDSVEAVLERERQEIEALRAERR